MTILNLPQVKSYESKGRRYHYHRPSGARICRAGTKVPIDPETEPDAFLDRVRELDRQAEAAALVEPTIGTLRPLIEAWRDSSEWKALSAETRYSYERVVDPERGTVRKLAAMQLDQVTPPFMVRLRDSTAKRRGRWLGNYTVTVLRILFDWGRLRGHLESNPAEGVPQIARPDDAAEINRRWAEAEFDAMLGRAREKNLPGVVKALALGRWAGMRIGDIVSVPPSAWDGTWLRWIPKKSRRKKRVVTVRAIRELRDVLDTDPSTGSTLVLNLAGRPYTRDGLQTMVWRMAKDLENEGKVGSGLSMHGLRHSLGSDLYDLQLERSTRKAALGHESDAASQVYERGGDRGRLADKAFRRLESARAKRRQAGDRQH